MRLYITIPVLLLGVGCQGLGGVAQPGDGSRPDAVGAAARAPGGGSALVVRWPASGAVEPPASLAQLAPSGPRGGKPDGGVEPAGWQARQEAEAPRAPARTIAQEAAVTAPARESAPGSTTVVHTTMMLASPEGPVAWSGAPGCCQHGDVVPAHVQTTTTYGHCCNLSMDYCCVRIPFPHLRISTIPKKVVTETDYVRTACPAPCTQAPTAPPARTAAPPAPAASAASAQESSPSCFPTSLPMPDPATAGEASRPAVNIQVFAEQTPQVEEAVLPPIQH
jgi:hypothetical protein